MTSQPSQTLTATVEAPDRLDRFLALAFPEVSRARFQRLIAEGYVAVEGVCITETRHKLKAGQRVEAVIPPAVAAEPQPEIIPLNVVYEDKDLIIIDKPAGLVVHPGAGNETGTLVNALIAHCGDSLSGIGGVKRPGIVHRLDKDTSGLLVIAKNDAAHRGLSEQFAAHGRDGRLERAYQAIVWGAPERSRGTVSANIARSNTNRQKMAISKSEASREAVTHYEVLKTFGKPPIASLVRCVLETGRTHQIRVHMTHIGHPLLGDRVYGASFKSSLNTLSGTARDAVNTLNRQALHAGKLGFEHPRTGKALSFESPLPADMMQLLAAFTR
jgi:23S rRNA pseudouridine1911/1915/1917 synthase